MTKEIKQTKDIQTVIDELAIKGVEALNEMADFTQEQVITLFTKLRLLP